MNSLGKSVFIKELVRDEIDLRGVAITLVSYGK